MLRKKRGTNWDICTMTLIFYFSDRLFVSFNDDLFVSLWKQLVSNKFRRVTASRNIIERQRPNDIFRLFGIRIIDGRNSILLYIGLPEFAIWAAVKESVRVCVAGCCGTTAKISADHVFGVMWTFGKYWTPRFHRVCILVIFSSDTLLSFVLYFSFHRSNKGVSVILDFQHIILLVLFDFLVFHFLSMVYSVLRSTILNYALPSFVRCLNNTMSVCPIYQSNQTYN